MCGENASDDHLMSITLGSPPHVRGKPNRPPGFPYCPRITPACAGKTDLLCWRSFCEGDHPRMCGENH